VLTERVKFDILGLKNITELKEQFDLVKEIYGVDINFNNIPTDDQKTWDIIGQGHTMGVFQFSSNLAVSVVTKIKPRSIEELSAANSFIRPGSSGLEEYLAAKIDKSKIRKIHPDIDPILEVTYGAIVYQEQIMSIIATVMDIDFGEADIYRRWLEKPEKNAENVAKWKQDFIRIGLEKGYSQKLVDMIVQLIIDNSGYGFNKSHSIAYSIIGYWTAYMKVNFPLVFYTTVLNGNLDEADAFMAEARKIGIEILPPHVNNSKLIFTIEGEKSIRAGFNAVKGVGPKAVESIVKNQPFVSVNDYFERNDKSALNKGVVSALINSGAFDGLGIEVGENDIPFELQDKFSFIEKEDKKYVVLNRKQMEKWFELLTEINTRKAVTNHIVPPELIKGKYFSMFELIEEKDGGFVVPLNKLSDIGLKLEDLPDQSPTRKKPKGSFSKDLDPMKNIPVFRKPLITHHRELSEIKSSYLELYLYESEHLGFSFLSHPMEKHMDKINIYSDVNDGEIMVTAGIIIKIEQKMTKNKKPYYWVFVKSPRDIVRVTIWGNQYKSHKDIIEKHKLVIVKGTKGFGGLGMEVIRGVKFEG